MKPIQPQSKKPIAKRSSRTAADRQGPNLAKLRKDTEQLGILASQLQASLRCNSRHTGAGADVTSSEIAQTEKEIRKIAASFATRETPAYKSQRPRRIIKANVSRQSARASAALR